MSRTFFPPTKHNARARNAESYLFDSLVRRLSVAVGGEPQEHLILMKSDCKVILDDALGLKAKSVEKCCGPLARINADRMNRWLCGEALQANAKKLGADASPLILAANHAPNEPGQAVVT